MAKVGDQQKQPICVECGNSVPELYTPNSSPGNIKLAICDKCHSFADKYVEYDIVLTALDLILHRLSVYRHIMYNHARDTSDFITGYKRLLIGVLVMTCHVKMGLLPPNTLGDDFMVKTAVVGTTVLEIGLIGLTIAVLLSFFPHLFFLLIVIWQYPPHFISLMHFFFWTSTTVGLTAYVKSPFYAVLIVLAAAGVNYGFFQLLCEFRIPAVHMFASTAIYPKIAKIATQLATFDF